MTTYDDIWSAFRSKCKINDLDLPASDDAIYATILNAISRFNLELDGYDLAGDNATETLSMELNGDEILLLAHCIRVIVLENQLIYFSGTFSPFTKEIGTRNLSNQMGQLKNLVEREDEIISSISLKMAVDFM